MSRAFHERGLALNLIHSPLHNAAGEPTLVLVGGLTRMEYAQRRVNRRIRDRIL